MGEGGVERRRKGRAILVAKAFPRFCVLPSAGSKAFPDNRLGLQIVNPKPDCAEYCWQLEFLTAVNCLV